jgi:CDP-diacylglycerol--serine O-phosphatidyltransferase
MEKIKKIREIYLLPSFFTTLNIFFGYLSILATFRGKYLWAAYWIIIAAVMDAIDGIIARSTKTQSDFGIQFDSLADAFSFGAAPSLLLYSWGFKGAGFPGFGIFFLLHFSCSRNHTPGSLQHYPDG